MAHLSNINYDKHAEVGWVERLTSAGNKRWDLFWEVRIGSTLIGGFNSGSSFNCCPVYRFRVANVQGTQLWKFWYDLNANGGWTPIGPDDGVDANFGKGVPQAETSRRGGEATGASDVHEDLRYKPCEGCNYINWPDNVVRKDEITNWHSERITNNSYRVVKDT